MKMPAIYNKKKEVKKKEVDLSPPVNADLSEEEASFVLKLLKQSLNNVNNFRSKEGKVRSKEGKLI